MTGWVSASTPAPATGGGAFRPIPLYPLEPIIHIVRTSIPMRGRLLQRVIAHITLHGAILMRVKSVIPLIGQRLSHTGTSIIMKGTMLQKAAQVIKMKGLNMGTIYRVFDVLNSLDRIEKSDIEDFFLASLERLKELIREAKKD